MSDVKVVIDDIPVRNDSDNPDPAPPMSFKITDRIAEFTFVNPPRTIKISLGDLKQMFVFSNLV